MPQRHRWRVVIAVVAAITALVATRDGSVRPPAAAYDHDGFAEVSIATEDVVDGQAGIVVGGLRERGYWCLQPRSNERAVQIACRSSGHEDRVDLVSTPGGDVLYADVDVSRPSAGAGRRVAGAGDRLLWVLGGSLLRLWPEDRTAVEALVGDAQPDGFVPLGGAAPPSGTGSEPSTNKRRTDNASWSVRSWPPGEPRSLRAVTGEVTDRSWPLASGHYATSLKTATAALMRVGFRCGQGCYRSSDEQAVHFVHHAGQITAIEFTLRSSAERADRPADPSGRWVRSRLPFLTPAVRGEIGRRVERCRLQRRSWRGLVAGTPVEIEAVAGASLLAGDRPAFDMTVTIGIPLLHVE